MERKRQTSENNVGLPTFMEDTKVVCKVVPYSNPAGIAQISCYTFLKLGVRHAQLLSDRAIFAVKAWRSFQSLAA